MKRLSSPLRRVPVLLILLGMLALFQVVTAAPGLAQDAAQGTVVVGWVQKAEGSVSLVEPSGDIRPAAVQAEVMARDTVATGADGRAQIVFTDRTMLALGGDSRLLVKDAMDMDGGGRLDLEFIEGAARVVASEVLSANPDNFQLGTPLGRIGIRGTEFGSLVATDHEAHLLYEGGPVVYTDEQGLPGDNAALKADACEKLATARDMTEAALGWLKGSDFKQRQAMKRQLADIEEKRAQLACGQ